MRTHVIEAGELLMTRMAALEPGRSRRSQATDIRPRALADRGQSASTASAPQRQDER